MQIDKDTTESKLLEAARVLFAKEGFDGATTRDICKAAGANVASINYHFGNKEGLYSAVIERAFDMVWMPDFSNMDSLPPDRFFKDFMIQLIRNMSPLDADKWNHMLVHQEIQNPRTPCGVRLRASIDEMQSKLSELFRKISKGGLSELQELIISTAIIGQCLFMLRRPPEFLETIKGNGGLEKNLVLIADTLTQLTLHGASSFEKLNSNPQPLEDGFMNGD